MPVENFQQALTTQTGVVKDQTGEIHVRGGRGGEVTYMIDGMSIKDPLVGGAFGMRLGRNAVEEMAVITGGFNAEYGDAQSGVVNLVTREGGGKTSGTLYFKTDDAGPLNKYKRWNNSDVVEFSIGGPEPLTGKLLPAIGLRLPGEISYFLSGDGTWTNTDYAYPRIYRELRQGTDPEPVTPRETMGIKLADRQDNQRNVNFKLTHRLGTKLKTTLGLRGSRRDYINFDWKWRDEPWFSYRTRTNSNQQSIGITHTLTSNTFYDLKLSRFKSTSRLRPGGREPNEFSMDPDSQSWYRSNADSNRDGFLEGFDQWVHHHDRETVTWSGRFDFNSQINRSNLVKSGFEVKYYDVSMSDIQYSYYTYDGPIDNPQPFDYDSLGNFNPRGAFRNFYRRYPTQAAAYLQDKIETKGMIINAGLRLDYWYAGNQVKTFVDPITLDTTETTNHVQISPRLGVSHPITDNDLLFFNYGLFSQVPEFQYIYELATQSASAIKYYGFPNLAPEKTVQYELGVKHAFSNNLAGTFTGFFKDIRGLVAMERRGQAPLIGYQFYNGAYGSCRGLTATFDKRYSNYTSGSLSYTLQWAYGNASSDRAGYNADPKSVPVREYPLDWDERHSVTMNLDFRVPDNEHPSLFGLRLPDRWGVNVLMQHGSGLPFTFDPPGRVEETGRVITNSSRRPSTQTWDLKANKDFNFRGLSYSFVLEVLNLFDRINIMNLYGGSFRPDTPYWLDAPDPGIREGQYTLWAADPKTASGYYNNPLNYGPRRIINFGLSLSW
jgi:hypothetical protein